MEEKTVNVIPQSHLRNLRQLAASSQTAQDFCQLTEKLLLSNFDQAFEFLKTQKLFTKSRSPATVCEVAAILNKWCDRAPLSGKRKAVLRRHLAICERVQQLFSMIDAESSTLRIWKHGKADAALVLLHSVEQFYNTCMSEGEQRNWEGLGVLESLDSSRSLRDAHRSYCDAALTVLRRISARCPSEGIPFDSPEDLAKAVQLAERFDDLSLGFDHYTFNHWRATISASDVRFQPSFDEYDRARQWSAQRTEAADHSFRAFLADEFTKAEKIAAEKCSGTRPSNNFEEFLRSNVGLTIRTELTNTRRAMLQYLNERVSSIFDLGAEMATDAGIFKISDLLAGWSAIWSLSWCARIWNFLRPMGEVLTNDALHVPVMTHNSIDDFIAKESGVTQQTAAKLREQFSAELENHSSLDLFYRPFLRFSEREAAFAVSYAETSRFDRNLFRIALLESNMDISSRGSKPLVGILHELRGGGFNSTMNFPLFAQGKIRTDADLLAYKDGILFVGQAKIAIQADSIYEVWQVEQKLRTAASQLSRTLELVDHRENLDRITQEFGVCGQSPFREIVPFILTNDWHFTGIRITKFPVVDLSYLNLLLTGATLIVGRETRPVGMKLIRGERPTATELKILIQQPFHRRMFTKPKIHFISESVGNQSFSLPAIHAPNA